MGNWREYLRYAEEDWEDSETRRYWMGQARGAWYSEAVNSWARELSNPDRITPVERSLNDYYYDHDTRVLDERTERDTDWNEN